jgi:hypothetical protein
MANKLERRTRKGVMEARCPKCETWRRYDDSEESGWYFHAGDEDTYLATRCKSCEQERSAAWHRAKNVKAKKLGDAKRAMVKRSASTKTTVKKAAAKKPSQRSVTKKASAAA